MVAVLPMVFNNPRLPSTKEKEIGMGLISQIYAINLHQ